MSNPNQNPSSQNPNPGGLDDDDRRDAPGRKHDDQHDDQQGGRRGNEDDGFQQPGQVPGGGHGGQKGGQDDDWNKR